jgi:CBS domain-containing protein
VAATGDRLSNTGDNQKGENPMFESDSLEPGDLVEPEMLISPDRELRRPSHATPIRALPIKRPLMLAADTSVAEAARLMMEGDARAALIVSGDNVLGIVTENDVWKAMTINFAG